MTDPGPLHVPFSLRGLGGLITVLVGRNTEPGALGYSLLTGGGPVDFARGFPVCRATVSYGHLALLRAGYPGWTFDAGFAPA